MKMRKSFHEACDKVVAIPGTGPPANGQILADRSADNPAAGPQNLPNVTKAVRYIINYCANCCAKVLSAQTALQTILRIAAASRWLNPQQLMQFAHFRCALRNALRAVDISRAEQRDLCQYACLSWLSFAFVSASIYRPVLETKSEAQPKTVRQGLPDLLLSDLLMARAWAHLARLAQRSVAEADGSGIVLPDKKRTLWQGIATIHKEYYRNTASHTTEAPEALCVWQQAILSLLTSG